MANKLIILSDAIITHTQKWATYFRDNSFDVHVISLRPAEIEGVTVHVLQSKAYANRKNNMQYNKVKVLLDVVPQIKGLVKQIQPDLLHAHHVSSYGLFGALSGFHPYAISAWGYDTITFPEKNFINRWMITYSLSKADILFATSKFLAAKTERFTDKKIIITPFGVNINKFTPKPEKRDKFIFGTIKALYPKYGVRYLIQAAKIVDKEIPNWELWIAGSGTEEENLKNLTKSFKLENKIKFLGRIPHEKVPETLQKMDVFIVPSIWECETFGVAAVEAAAVGLPVIASNLGGLPEVVLNDKTGFLVPPKAHTEIAEKLIYLYKNKEIKEQMGKDARQFVLDTYVWEENARIMLEAYKYLIS
jgi:glycosyltransferase involved in cell wall biosynthesis